MGYQYPLFLAGYLCHDWNRWPNFPKSWFRKGRHDKQELRYLWRLFFVGILSPFFFDTWLDGGLEYVLLSFTLKNEGKILCWPSSCSIDWGFNHHIGHPCAMFHAPKSSKMPRLWVIKVDGKMPRSCCPNVVGSPKKGSTMVLSWEDDEWKRWNHIGIDDCMYIFAIVFVHASLLYTHLFASIFSMSTIKCNVVVIKHGSCGGRTNMVASWNRYTVHSKKGATIEIEAP